MTAGWNIDVPTTDYYGPDPKTGIWSSENREALGSLLRELADVQVIAIDTETTGLVVWRDIPLYFSLAWGRNRCCLHASILPYFQNIFNDPTKWWIMANAKYDTHILSNVGAHPFGRLVDTCVMHALLYEEKPHGLKFMCKHIGGWSWGDFQDQFGKINASQSPQQLIERAEREDFERLKEYAANDAWGTLLVYQELRKQLEAAPTHSLFRDKPPYIETLWDLFHKVEVPYTRTLWRMERHGVKINKDVFAKARPDAVKNIETVEGIIQHLSNNPKINMNSPLQMRKWLLEDLKLAPVSYSKGGKTGVRTPSVDAEFLQYHADKGNEACKQILIYRDYKKLLGTYIDGMSSLVDPYDRIHTRYNQDVARTGRLSSSEPNLQNIPRPENDHWELRSAFVPEAGYTLLDFDYGQLEMRLLAAAALEKSMIDMINSGKDIHMGNAELVFGMPYADIVEAKKAKERGDKLSTYQKECLVARNATKSIGFGLLYGMGAAKLANTLNCTLEEAEAKIAQFLHTYPGVKAFTEEAVRETERTGYAFTVLGRRRNIPEIRSTSRKERSRGERLAVNTQIQGSAADVVKMAQILYDSLGYERDFGCKQILQVHDELLFECPTEHVPFMLREIQSLMEHPFSEDFQVQLEAEGGSGDSWHTAK